MRKNMITRSLNNTLLKTQWVKVEIKEEIKKCFETNDNENTTIQYLQQKQSKRGNIEQFRAIDVGLPNCLMYFD